MADDIKRDKKNEGTDIGHEQVNTTVEFGTRQSAENHRIILDNLNNRRILSKETRY